AEVFTSAQPGDTLSHVGRHAVTAEMGEDPLDAEPTRIESALPGLDQGLGATEDQPKLVIIGGNDRGKEFPLVDGDNGIGRGLDNIIVLADIAVSRKHTLVCKEDGLFVVRDLGSGNGTLVNGAQIEAHRLLDGDQIELGNTLLRFAMPLAVLAEAPTMIGVVPGDAPALSAPMVQPQPEPITAQHGVIATQQRRGLSRRQKLLIFGGGGVALLLVAAVGAKFALKKQAPPAAPKVNASVEASRHYDKGLSYFRTRKWQLARDHCLKVYALAPDFDEAKRCAKGALAEKRAQEVLEQAKKDLKKKDYQASRALLAKIPASSVYTKDVRALKQQADDEQIEALIASAKKLTEAGDAAAARAKLKEARKVSPTNQVVKTMLEDLNKGRRGHKRVAVRGSAPRTSKRRPRTHTPRRPRRSSKRPVKALKGSTARKALALYRKGNFEQAARLLSEYAGKLSGRRRAKTKRLASAMKRAGMAITQARKTRNTGMALKLYRSALKYDGAVSGSPHRAKLRSEAVRVARIHAAASLNKKAWRTAYEAMRAAQRYGAPKSAVQSILTRLEKEAKKLFERGYMIRQRNVNKAQALWQQVLRIVPPSSKIYKEAYRWLNSSGSGYQDEDED
ncbi:MAG: FHA domain-containing protein, partial [Deltaproteobacteria bacterium]|nr:FHA domain-containing protein [Deltaproteobacteria bacterium]